MCTTCFNVTKTLYIAHRVYFMGVLWMSELKNYHFPQQHELLSLCSGGVTCLLWGRDRIFKYYFNSCFKGIDCSFYLTTRFMSQNFSKKPASNSQQTMLCWALLTLQPWRHRRYVPPKRQLPFRRLHGVMYQKVEFPNILLLFLFVLAVLNWCDKSNIGIASIWHRQAYTERVG
jgi:hypothetical protein